VPAAERAVVVDASVVLKLLLREEGSEAVHSRWREWVEADTEITAPFLLAYEVISVLRNKVFRQEFPPEAGDAAFAAFVSQEVSLLHPDGIEETAWALARRWNLPAAYDATYLALAEVTACEFWTADRRFSANLRKAAKIRLV
jgi:predicted nucleic acid-binding protein